MTMSQQQDDHLFRSKLRGFGSLLPGRLSCSPLHARPQEVLHSCHGSQRLNQDGVAPIIAQLLLMPSPHQVQLEGLCQGCQADTNAAVVSRDRAVACRKPFRSGNILIIENRVMKNG